MNRESGTSYWILGSSIIPVGLLTPAGRRTICLVFAAFFIPSTLGCGNGEHGTAGASGAAEIWVAKVTLTDVEKDRMHNFGLDPTFFNPKIELPDGTQCPALVDVEGRFRAYRKDDEWRDTRSGKPITDTFLVARDLLVARDSAIDVVHLASGRLQSRSQLTPSKKKEEAVRAVLDSGKSRDVWKELVRNGLFRIVAMYDQAFFKEGHVAGNAVMYDRGQTGGEVEETWQLGEKDAVEHVVELAGRIEKSQGGFRLQVGTFGRDTRFFNIEKDYSWENGKLRITLFDRDENSVSAVVAFNSATVRGQNDGMDVVEKELGQAAVDVRSAVERVRNGWIIAGAYSTRAVDRHGNGIQAATSQFSQNARQIK